MVIAFAYVTVTIEHAAGAALTLGALLFAVALLITLVSSLEDCFLDLFWLSCKLTGSKAAAEGLAPPSDDTTSERPLAILLPAWQEARVLPKSVSHLLTTARYRSYTVFIGSYINDPATRRAVEEIAASDSRVVGVTVPRPGPTCKADCLNVLLAAALEIEEQHGLRFAAFVLQDAEDVTHPDALLTFNRCLGNHDLIQLPVFPVIQCRHHLVGGHYRDEFAEMHGKEVPARNQMSGIVPGAGVATAYARDALVAERQRVGEVFSTLSLTEDYDLSHRLAFNGSRQIFLRLPSSSGPGFQTRLDLVGTRELFPSRFRAAVRQKARWIVGISCQGWQRFGWQGSLAARYLFLRDRKGLFCGHLSLLSYLGLSYLLGRQAIAEAFPAWTPPPLLPPDSLLWDVAALNLLLLLHRLVVRHVCVWAVHGWRDLPFVLPRYVVGVVINYAALCRATAIYLAHLYSGRPIGWDKTDHAFPDATSTAQTGRQDASVQRPPVIDAA